MIQHSFLQDTTEEILDLVSIGSKPCSIHATSIQVDNQIVVQGSASTTQQPLLASKTYSNHHVIATCIDDQVTLRKDNQIITQFMHENVQSLLFLEVEKFVHPVIDPLDKPVVQDLADKQEDQSETETETETEKTGADLPPPPQTNQPTKPHEEAPAQVVPSLVLATWDGSLSKYHQWDDIDHTKTPTPLVHRTGKTITTLRSAHFKNRLLCGFSDGSCSVYCGESLVELALLIPPNLKLKDRLPEDQVDPIVAIGCNDLLQDHVSYIGTLTRSGIITVWSASSIFFQTTSIVLNSLANEEQHHSNFVSSSFANEIALQLAENNGMSKSKGNEPDEETVDKDTLMEPRSTKGVVVVGTCNHNDNNTMVRDALCTDLQFVSKGIFITSGNNRMNVWSTRGVQSGLGIQLVLTLKCGFFVMRMLVHTSTTTSAKEEEAEVAEEAVHLVAGGDRKLLHFYVNTNIKLATSFGVPAHTLDLSHVVSAGSDSLGGGDNSRNSSHFPEVNHTPMKGLLFSNGLVEPTMPFNTQEFMFGTSPTNAGRPPRSPRSPRSPRFPNRNNRPTITPKTKHLVSPPFNRKSPQTADASMMTMTTIKLSSRPKLKSRNNKKKTSNGGFRYMYRNRQEGTKQQRPQRRKVQQERTFFETTSTPHHFNPWVMDEGEDTLTRAQKFAYQTGEWKLHRKKKMTGKGQTM